MLRGRGRGRGGSIGSSRGGATRLRGLFADGDCDPRLPAEHFKVKKEGKNQGRWFYTCQKSEAERCGFFLWDDDANLREEGAVMQNARTEPRSTVGVLDNRHNASRETPRTSKARVSPPPPYSAESSTSTLTNQAQVGNSAQFDDTDDDDWPMDVSEMQKLESEALAKSPSKRPQEPQTPAKRNFAMMNDTGLMTPQTEHRLRSGYSADDAGASKRRATELSFLDIVSPATTPTPARFRDALGASSDDRLFAEIKDAISSNGATLNAAALNAVKVICGRQTMRTRGVEKGREISQLAIKAKDAKVAELLMRITTLEAELETERAIIKHLRSEHTYDEG